MGLFIWGLTLIIINLLLAIPKGIDIWTLIGVSCGTFVAIIGYVQWKEKL